MSKDLVVLGRREPDVAGVAEACGSMFRVNGAGWPVQVFDDAGRLVLTVENPVPVEAQGEIERLLGVRADPPVWWIDVRAAADVEEAAAVARELASELAGRFSGVVWSSR